MFQVHIVRTSVRKVEARHVHALSDEEADRFGLIGRRSQRAHNLGIGARNGELVQAQHAGCIRCRHGTDSTTNTANVGLEQLSEWGR
jgi:hypothetical protein